MTKTSYKNGFSIVELVLILAVLAIIGAVGYFAYNNFIGNKSTASSQAASTSGQNETVEPISDKSDLQAAQEALKNSSADSIQDTTKSLNELAE